MARPDIKAQRKEQILDAFETCVARYGVEGATLAKTAEIAGLARPLVRHNVGNREELLDALVERFLEKSDDIMREFLASLPEEKGARIAVDLLFDPQYSDSKLVQVSSALIAASANEPSLSPKMQQWLNTFIARLEHLLATDYPEASAEMIAAVSAGITGIYFNVESIYPLGDIDAVLASSKKAALILLDSLETNS